MMKIPPKHKQIKNKNHFSPTEMKLIEFKDGR